jgi:hypothetical protein
VIPVHSGDRVAPSPTHSGADRAGSRARYRECRPLALPGLCLPRSPSRSIAHHRATSPLIYLAHSPHRHLKRPSAHTDSGSVALLSIVDRPLVWGAQSVGIQPGPFALLAQPEPSPCQLLHPTANSPLAALQIARIARTRRPREAPRITIHTPTGGPRPPRSRLLMPTLPAATSNTATSPIPQPPVAASRGTEPRRHLRAPTLLGGVTTGMRQTRQPLPQCLSTV